MNITVIPMPGWLAVKLIPAENKKGSLLLPEKTAEERVIKEQLEPTIAEVLAVGDARCTEYGAFLDPVCKVGDLVVVNRVGARPLLVGPDTQNDYIWFIREAELYTRVTSSALKES